MTITNTDFQNIALAISAYADEAYTTAKKLNGTGLVASDQHKASYDRKMDSLNLGILPIFHA